MCTSMFLGRQPPQHGHVAPGLWLHAGGVTGCIQMGLCHEAEVMLKPCSHNSLALQDFEWDFAV